MQKWVCFSIAQRHTEKATTIRRNLSARSFGIGYLFGANLLRVFFWQAFLGSPKLFSDIKITYGVHNNSNTVTEAKISHRLKQT